MFREIIFFKTYYLDFIGELDARARVKFDFLLEILRTRQFVPTNYAKHISGSDGIFELRVSIGSKEYRALFFFETGDLISGGRVVILGNGFLKKDNRDYKRAVELAQNIRDEFFGSKV